MRRLRSRSTALLAPLALGMLLTGCGGGGDGGAGDAGTAPTEDGGTGAPPTGCDYPADGRGAARDVGVPDAADIPEADTVSATLVTSAGDVGLELAAGAAPCTVASLVHLAEEGYFADTPCHRLTTQGIFVLQCGDPTGSGRGGPGYSFANENTEGASYDRGTLAMANAGPDTNGSQFFLVYDDSPLPPEYSVFGSVTEEGLAVLDEVAAAGAQGGGADGPPAMPVQVEELTVG